MTLAVKPSETTGKVRRDCGYSKEVMGDVGVEELERPLRDKAAMSALLARAVGNLQDAVLITDTDAPSSLAFALHGGVPLAFAHGKHYSFELIPELNAGFTSGTIKSAVATTPDVNLSGFRLDLGARVGAEIYFGFIGVPQLSLQASVGAYFTHQAWKVSQGATSESVTATTLGTTVQDAPWAIFVNNISALYYF